MFNQSRRALLIAARLGWRQGSSATSVNATTSSVGASAASAAAVAAAVAASPAASSIATATAAAASTSSSRLPARGLALGLPLLRRGGSAAQHRSVGGRCFSSSSSSSSQSTSRPAAALPMPWWVQRQAATGWHRRGLATEAAAVAKPAAGGPGTGRGTGAGGGGGGGGGSGGRSPVSFASMLLGAAAFLAAVAAAQHTAQQRVDGMMRRSQRAVGKAAVGGPFSLVDQDGKSFTERDLLGRWTLLYFGFTHCPDICPDELDKICEAVDLVSSSLAPRGAAELRPVFVTVDAARDTPAKVKEYVAGFHPRLVGLTGTEEAVSKAAKAYRVYFHRTDDDGGGGGASGGNNNGDYLVDHSIITYLLDPQGEFVTFYGKNFDANTLAASIAQHMAEWQEGGAAGGKAEGAADGQAGSQEGRAQR